MGPSGSGQVDADAHPRGSRQADLRRGLHRRNDITTLGDTDLTKLRRRHIGFVFQFFNLLPMLTAEENVAPAALDRRQEAGKRVLRGAPRDDRPGGPAQAPPRRAVRRTAAAGRDRSRARLAADGHLRGRADRQPRLEHERRDPRADAALGRRIRADDGDGHARGARCGDRRPHSLPRRWADRPRPRPHGCTRRAPR